ncbi:MAG: hypothetical protein ACKO34_08200 [Vampirovibrionales bacterium]
MADMSLRTQQTFRHFEWLKNDDTGYQGKVERLPACPRLAFIDNSY